MRELECKYSELFSSSKAALQNNECNDVAFCRNGRTIVHLCDFIHFKTHPLQIQQNDKNFFFYLAHLLNVSIFAP